MPRVKPQYIWPLTDGKKAEGENVKHRVTYKSGGKKFKTSKPPASLPSQSTGQSDVQFGSHANVDRKIAEEMRRLGL